MSKLEKMIKNLDELIKLQEKALEDMKGIQEEIDYLKEYREALEEASNEDLKDFE